MVEAMTLFVLAYYWLAAEVVVFCVHHQKEADKDTSFQGWWPREDVWHDPSQN